MHNMTKRIAVRWRHVIEERFKEDNIWGIIVRLGCHHIWFLEQRCELAVGSVAGFLFVDKRSGVRGLEIQRQKFGNARFAHGTERRYAVGIYQYAVGIYIHRAASRFDPADGMRNVAIDLCRGRLAQVMNFGSTREVYGVLTGFLSGPQQ